MHSHAASLLHCVLMLGSHAAVTHNTHCIYAPSGCTARRRVVWVSSSHAGLTFQLSYPQIVMHAVSRDTSSFPHACIYLQLDEGEDDEAMLAAAGHEDDDQDEGAQQGEDIPAELRLVPSDAAKSGYLLARSLRCRLGGTAALPVVCQGCVRVVQEH